MPPTARSYKAVELEAASPGERVVEVYRILETRMAQAVEAIEGLELARRQARDVEVDRSLREEARTVEAQAIQVKSLALLKAQEAVLLLSGVLDTEQGGEIATTLRQLYGYFYTTLAEVNRTDDLEVLERLLDMVEGLRESWEEASEIAYA